MNSTSILFPPDPGVCFAENSELLQITKKPALGLAGVFLNQYLGKCAALKHALGLGDFQFDKLVRKALRTFDESNPIGLNKATLLHLRGISREPLTPEKVNCVDQEFFAQLQATQLCTKLFGEFAVGAIIKEGDILDASRARKEHLGSVISDLVKCGCLKVNKNNTYEVLHPANWNILPQTEYRAFAADVMRRLCFESYVSGGIKHWGFSSIKVSPEGMSPREFLDKVEVVKLDEYNQPNRLANYGEMTLLLPDTEGLHRKERGEEFNQTLKYLVMNACFDLEHSELPPCHILNAAALDSDTARVIQLSRTDLFDNFNSKIQGITLKSDQIDVKRFTLIHLMGDLRF